MNHLYVGIEYYENYANIFRVLRLFPGYSCSDGSLQSHVCNDTISAGLSEQVCFKNLDAPWRKTCVMKTQLPFYRQLYKTSATYLHRDGTRTSCISAGHLPATPRAISYTNSSCFVAFNWMITSRIRNVINRKDRNPAFFVRKNDTCQIVS